MSTKRGLLIGSATGGLSGVSHDIAAMARWLGSLGFLLDCREGVDATREGVFEGLERLIRDAKAGDAVVIYYSGHGGHSQVCATQRMVGERIAPRAVQYLVPTDHDKHEAFRGIFRAELSLAMQRLAEKTSNITMMLDCCHSTDMVRHGDDMLKGRVEPWGEGIEAHMAWLLEQGCDVERLPELRNSSVVLLSACEAARQAFEISRPSDGARCGLFTDCLLGVVGELSTLDGVSWDALMGRVVRRVRRCRAYQRPQVTGPSARALFSERRQRAIGALSVFLSSGRWCLEAGEAAGLKPGDRYQLVDPLAGDPRVVAEAEVSEVAAGRAALTVEPVQARTIESGMIALPRPGGPAHLRCRVDGTGPLADELRGRLPRLAGVEVVDEKTPGPLAFTADVTGDRVQIRGNDGARLRRPWRDEPAMESSSRRARLDELLADVRRLSRGIELVALARDLRERIVPRRLSHALEWGVVDRDGRPRRLPLRGAELTVGDRIFLAIENMSPWAIHVSIFDVGVGRAVTLLNPNEPEGIDLGSGETEIIGAPEYRSLSGLELQWPQDTPRDGPREESLVIFVSRDPLPLTCWETSSWCDERYFRSAEVGLEAQGEHAYVVQEVSFRLIPREATGRRSR